MRVRVLQAIRKFTVHVQRKIKFLHPIGIPVTIDKTLAPPSSHEVWSNVSANSMAVLGFSLSAFCSLVFTPPSPMDAAEVYCIFGLLPCVCASGCASCCSHDISGRNFTRLWLMIYSWGERWTHSVEESKSRSEQGQMCEWVIAAGGSIHTGAVLHWGRGHMPPPDSLVVPPDSKASWPFWRDFWGPKMLQSPNFPRTSLESLQHSPGPLTDGVGLPALSQEPYPRSLPFGPRFYGSQGLTHYRVGNPTNDRFQM